jgi:pimeloyl-ACP methyl ester carboxylesterase
MADALPRARLVLVEGAGHAVHLEAPDAVAEAISAT